MSENKRHIKKALRMQKMMSFLTKLQTVGSKPAGAERYVDTSHGKIKVLEYGFGTKGAAPLFIDMHGGGFVLGNAYMDEPMNLFFAKNAEVRVIDIDYPLAPQAPYPVALEAIYETIKHYIDNDEAYGIDRECVGIGGHSAGANFAAEVCIMAKEKGDLHFKYQILDYPPLDLVIDPFKRETPKGSVSPEMADMFNKCYVGDDVETAKSPYVSPVFASREQLIGLPSALIIAAGRDSLHIDGVTYAKMLEDAGVSVELHDFKESVHGFTYNKTSDAKDGHELMVSFIRKHI